MSLSQRIPCVEDIERPEIAVRLWPQSINFGKLGNAGRIALLASQGTEIDPHAVLFSLLTVTGGRDRPQYLLEHRGDAPPPQAFLGSGRGLIPRAQGIIDRTDPKHL